MFWLRNKKNIYLYTHSYVGKYTNTIQQNPYFQLNKMIKYASSISIVRVR